jgi:integrase
VAHVEDRWHKARSDGRQERTARYGTGRRWRVRYLDPDGTERNRSFDRKVDAIAFMNATAAKVDNGTWTDPAAGKITLRHYAERVYLPALTSEATSIKATESRFRTRILPALGDRTLGQLAAGPSVIRAWAAGLRPELSDSYIRTLLASLSAALNAALTDGLITRNPCSMVKPPKAPAARVQPWAVEWVDGVREAMPARYRALADVGAGLGLRQGEAFGLAAEDIDWLHRIVHVRRQVRIVGSTLCFAPPKGGRERDIPLPDSIALRLSTHVAACPPVPVSLPWKVPGGRPVAASLLFTAPSGAALHRSSFSAVAWKPALRGAGLSCSRENGMHALRHYFASACLHNGVDIRALASYLGHSDPGFTLRTYVHLMPSAGDRMRQAVDAAFASPDGPATARQRVR